jgi:hypothetical protein
VTAVAGILGATAQNDHSVVSDVLRSGQFWTGLIGLAGIIATFFAPTWSQKRLAERQEAREFRRARRLVHFELVHNASVLNVVKSAVEEDPPRFIDAKVLTVDWEANKATLAAGLDDGIWRTVCASYGAVWSASLAFPAGDPPEGSTETAVQMVTSMEAAVIAGKDALANARYVPPVAPSDG